MKSKSLKTGRAAAVVLKRSVRWRAQLYRDVDYVRIFPASNKEDDGCWRIIDVEEVGAGTEEEHSEGHICEYGWFNPDFEKEIKKFQEELNLSREEAMIRFFNER